MRTWLAIFVALAASACNRGVPEPNRPAPAPASPLAAVHAEHDLDGNIVGPAPAQTRATVVVVFASWCAPCRRELSLLGEIRKTQPSLRIIGLNAYEEWENLSDEQRLRSFVSENAPWLQVVRAEAPLLKAFGGVPQVPSLFVFDRAGGLVAEFQRKRRAPPNRTELERAIDGAIMR